MARLLLERNVLQESAQEPSSYAADLFTSRTLAEQRELLPLIPMSLYPDFGPVAAWNSISSGRLDTLELLLGRFGESIDAGWVKSSLARAYQSRDAELARLLLMYLKVDPTLKEEYCAKATADGLHDLIPVLCGIAIKGAHK